MDILYVKDKSKFGYHKITAIKDHGWQWGSGELDGTFGIITKTISDEKIQDWANTNKYCINDDEDGITETPVEYQITIPPEGE